MTIAAYLLLWLTHFHYVYGWFADDRTVYAKGLETVRDWTAAFRGTNALQPYFWVVSYLPLKLAVQFGLSLPSYPLPGFEALTGQFRFFLLYAVFVHAAILGLWAWCAEHLTTNRLAAWLSLLLFASSPTLMLWTPQPESRLFPLAFILPGLVLLLRVDPTRTRGIREAAQLFLVGSLWSLAQSIHYTGLYVIVPLVLVYWAVWLPRGWRRVAYWRNLIVFGIACAWLPIALEAVSYFVVGIPWEQGPLMSTLGLTNVHLSSWSTWGTLGLWAEWFHGQMGPVLEATIGLGWLWCLWQRRPGRVDGGSPPLFVVLAIPLGLTYLGVWGKEAFFRQTSVLQPFLFLFAALAIVAIAELGRRPVYRTGLIVALLGVVAWAQWGQAAAVFAGHQGWGRALEWAHTHQDGHALQTTRVEWYRDRTSVTTIEDLELADPDSLLLTYIPTDFLMYHASLVPALERTKPLAAWPTLWSTRSMEAEIGAYWPNSHWWDNPVGNEARVYRIGDIVAQMPKETLRVVAVTADSVASPKYEAVNVFDRERSPDDAVVWISAATPMPHWVDTEFAAPVPLSQINVVQPLGELSTRKISTLEIQAAGVDGTYRTVWRGQDLARFFVITAQWQPLLATHVRVVVHAQPWLWADNAQGIIEEVEFPGYQIAAPVPQRSFQELALSSLEPSASGIVVSGSNLTRATRLVVDGVTLPSREGAVPNQMVALLPAALENREGEVEAYLADGFRRSNTLQVRLSGPLGLTQNVAAGSP